MTNSPPQKPSPNARAKYIYRGPNERANNVIFQLLSSPDREGDEWKNGSENLVYLESLDKYIQPDNVKDQFVDYSMGPMDGDVIVNAPLPKVNLSSGKGEAGEADGQVGGFFAAETPENFAKYYHQIGKK